MAGVHQAMPVSAAPNGKRLLTISQSLMPNIEATNYLRVRMLSSTLLSTAAGQAILLTGLCAVALAFAGILYRRQTEQNRRLSTAVENMSQGLCMFNPNGRIVLYNSRYIEMYKLSPQIVRPGCSLHDLMQHRKETGVFLGDIET
jgi:PAS domain-containing protein